LVATGWPTVRPVRLDPVACAGAVRPGIVDAMWTGRLDRPRVALGLSAAAFAIPIVFALLVPHPLEQPLGVDFQLYRDVTARWLAGGPFYQPYQLAGPYPISAGDVLYPPVALWLFVPFSIGAGTVVAAVQAVLWWGVALGVVAAVVVVLRPRPLVWPLIALCVANPTTLLKIWTGNPVMWSMAAMALAVVGASRFATPFVLLKPSLAPFALFGVRRRSWWLGAVVFGLLCLPFGSMWADWVTTLVNSQGGGLLYSSLEFPMLLLPLVAWLGRTRRGGGPNAWA
jgi:hypothetical protein